MFCVSEAEATAIRTAYEQGGEFSAAIELRRLFPGITDNAKARECARTIAGWTPLPDPVQGAAAAPQTAILIRRRLDPRVGSSEDQPNLTKSHYPQRFSVTSVLVCVARGGGTRWRCVGVRDAG